MVGVGWGGMMTFFACGDMADATQLCWWMCIHGRCYLRHAGGVVG